MLSEIERRWNTDMYFEKAEDIIRGLGMEEFKSWRKHPCTEYLSCILKAGVSDRVQNWANGEYTSNTIEASTMKNAKVIGELQTIQDTLDIIEALANYELSEREDDRATGSLSYN